MTDLDLDLDLDELDRLYASVKERKGAFPFTDFFTAIHKAYPALSARLRELELQTHKEEP